MLLRLLVLAVMKVLAKGGRKEVVGKGSARLVIRIIAAAAVATLVTAAVARKKEVVLGV